MHSSKPKKECLRFHNLRPSDELLDISECRGAYQNLFRLVSSSEDHHDAPRSVSVVDYYSEYCEVCSSWKAFVLIFIYSYSYIALGIINRHQGLLQLVHLGHAGENAPGALLTFIRSIVLRYVSSKRCERWKQQATDMFRPPLSHKCPQSTFLPFLERLGL